MINERRSESWKTNDPAGRRRDCVGNQNSQPQGDAILPGASRPAVLDMLSAPVFRGGSRSLFRGYQALEFGFN